MEISQETLNKLWSRVNKTDTCWLWTGGVSSNGYGNILVGTPKKAITTHRLSYIIANGPVAGGLFVLHRCDVKVCVNPDHLWLGTQADNRRDCILKDRHSRGERHPHARLTRTVIQEIKQLVSQKTLRGYEIGRMYGVDPSVVSRINRNKYWGITDSKGGEKV